MLKWWTDWRKNRDRRKILVNFYREVERNWESVYVMQQRGVLEKFVLDAWRQIKGRTDLNLKDSVVNYGIPFEVYNAAMDEFKRFEQWYAADLNNKTAENVRILHEKKEAASEKFKGLLAVVAETKKTLERDLVAENILTQEMIISHAE